MIDKLHGQSISKIVGYSDSLESVIQPTSEDTEYYIEIFFEDIVYNPSVQLISETLHLSYYGIDFIGNIIPSLVIVETTLSNSM